MSTTQTFNPKDWHKLGAWSEYAFSMEFWFGKSFARIYRELYRVEPKTLLYFDGKLNHQYFSHDTVAACRAKFERPDAEKFFTELKRDLTDRRSRIMQLKDRYEASDEPFSFNTLVTDVYPLHTRNCVAAWSAFLYEQLFHDDVYRAFTDLRGSNAPREFPLLVTPRVESEPFLEQAAMLKAVLDVKQGKGVEVAAKDLRQRFGYLSVFQMGDPHDVDWYRSTLQRLLEKSADELRKEHHELGATREATLADQEKLERDLDLSESLRAHLRIFRLCAEIRTLNDETVSAVGSLQRRALLPVATRWKIPYRDLYLCTFDEVRRAVQEDRVDPTIIEARKTFFVGYTTPTSELVFLTGAPAREAVAAFLRSDAAPAKDIKEFKGFVAHPGHVRGRARIVANGGHAGQFDDGDILVAQQTTVDFVPLMRKASAIVTDQGGLTSHAAIVARELGKPCIVGTKVATKVLKDGDEVEVDAEKGIVRVLKRA